MNFYSNNSFCLFHVLPLRYARAAAPVPMQGPQEQRRRRRRRHPCSDRRRRGLHVCTEARAEGTAAQVSNRGCKKAIKSPMSLIHCCTGATYRTPMPLTWCNCASMHVGDFCGYVSVPLFPHACSPQKQHRRRRRRAAAEHRPNCRPRTFIRRCQYAPTGFNAQQEARRRSAGAAVCESRQRQEPGHGRDGWADEGCRESVCVFGIVCVVPQPSAAMLSSTFVFMSPPPFALPTPIAGSPPSSCSPSELGPTPATKGGKQGSGGDRGAGMTPRSLAMRSPASVKKPQGESLPP